MPTDHKRHLKLDENYDWVDAKEKVKSRAKPKSYEPTEYYKQYMLERDRLLYKEAKERGDIKTMEFLKNRHK